MKYVAFEQELQVYQLGQMVKMYIALDNDIIFT
jgi:hypothetical protein